MTYYDAIRIFLSLNPKYKTDTYNFILRKWAMFKNGLVCDGEISYREDESWRFPLYRSGQVNVLKVNLNK